MGNLDYQEPKSLDVAFDLIGDVCLNMAASQYGGYTLREIDKLLGPFKQILGLFDVVTCDTKGGFVPARMLFI